MQKLTKFKVIFDLFTVCVYFIQQRNCKLYYIYLMIISEIQSEIGHCSCDSANFKAPADFSHHAILCMTLSLKFVSGYLKPPSSPTPTQYFLNIVADFKGVWLYCFPIFSIKIKNVFIF